MCWRVAEAVIRPALRRGGLIACALFALVNPPARAQPVTANALDVSVESDLRVRGLSWSARQAALVAQGTWVPLATRAPDLAIAVEAMALRGSARHGGSAAGLAIAPRHAWHRGGWTITVGATGRAFTGHGPLAWGEASLGVSRMIGQVALDAGADYAPPQRALGGANLYVHAGASAGIPGTALTLFAGAGHSLGTADDSGRAARLRPGGAYLDHHLGAEYVAGRWVLGLRHTGTNMGERAKAVQGGNRLVATLRLSLLP